ncbi:MAG: type II toxin-antitoxin system RelE/ParE family toxin [Anaerolineae bacterium]
MYFVETTVFTRRIVELLSDEEYRQLQLYLVERPDAGKVIPGSGGLRKLRWGIGQTGKRGGVRVIYYWVVQQDTVLFLFAFRKNERSDLTPEQIRMLRQIVEEEYHE